MFHRLWNMMTSYANATASPVDTTERNAGIYQPIPKYAGNAMTLIAPQSSDGKSLSRSQIRPRQIFSVRPSTRSVPPITPLYAQYHACIACILYIATRILVGRIRCESQYTEAIHRIHTASRRPTHYARCPPTRLIHGLIPSSRTDILLMILLAPRRAILRIHNIVHVPNVIRGLGCLVAYICTHVPT
jgi:hypothetical protein